MKTYIAVLALFLTALVFCHAEVSGVMLVNSAPSGSCQQTAPAQYATSAGHLWSCVNGTWADTTLGATNTQTASYTIQASDNAKLVIMNCSSACTLTLNASPTPGSKVQLLSIGSIVPTVSLNGKNYNGAAAVPSINSYSLLTFWSDGANYFGEAPLVAGGNVTLTPATNGMTIAASGAGFDPVDRSVAWFREEFGGNQGVGNYGLFGACRAIAGSTASCAASQTATYPNLGATRITITNGSITSGQGTTLATDGNSGGPFGNMTAYTFDSYFIARMGATSNIGMYMGYGKAGALTSMPTTDWVGLRYDTSAGDVHYMLVVRSSSTSAIYDTGVSPDTNFHRIEIASTVAGKWLLALDGGTAATICPSGCTVTATLPTANMSAFISTLTYTTAAQWSDIDFFAFKTTGLAR